MTDLEDITRGLRSYMEGWGRGTSGKEPHSERELSPSYMCGYQHGLSARRQAEDIEREKLGLCSSSLDPAYDDAVRAPSTKVDPFLVEGKKLFDDFRTGKLRR